MIQNILLSSGQVIELATGENYTIKADEVFINDHPYKKSDLEIGLSNVRTVEPIDDIEHVHISVYSKRTNTTQEPAHLVPYNQWSVDNVVPSSLSIAVELINTAISIETDTQVLDDILTQEEEANAVLSDIKEKPNETEILICIEENEDINIDNENVRVLDLDDSYFTDAVKSTQEFFVSNFIYDSTWYYLFDGTSGGHLNYTTTNRGDTILIREENGSLREWIDIFKDIYDSFELNTGLKLPDYNYWGIDLVNYRILIPEIGYGVTADMSLFQNFETKLESGNGSGNFTSNITVTSSVESYNVKGELLTKTGSLVKQFDDLGAEIITNRKFYIKGIEVTEPEKWNEGQCSISQNSSTQNDTTNAVNQNIVRLDKQASSLNTLTIPEKTITYLDISIVDVNGLETGNIDINAQATIPLSTNSTPRYEAVFDSYVDGLNPHQIDITFETTVANDGYMIIESGSIV